MKSRLKYLRGVTLGSLAACFSSAAFAQWSDDPAANLIVGDDPGGASQPHTVAAPGGGFYVSWNASSGGFDIRLQRLDADGNELWAHDGILVADRSYDFTYDYGLAVDASGNAYLSYNCCVNNSPTEHIVVSKALPDGTLAWGADGITLETASAEAVYNAFVTIASDGNAVVAWTSDSGVRAQKISAEGNILWAPDGVLMTQPTGVKFLADIEPALGGDVILSWSNQAGSTRILRAQRLASEDGAPRWGSGTAVRVFNDGNLQAAYFPKFIADGEGGGVFYDYDASGGAFNARVQHIDANGNYLLDASGVLATTDVSNLHTNTMASYDSLSGSIYVIWRDTVQKSLDTYDGVSAQRIDANGNRMWTDGGKVLVPLTVATDGAHSISQLTAVLADNDAILSWVTGAIPTADQAITAARLNGGGNYVWSSQTVAIKSTGYTSRTSAAVSEEGFAAYVTEDGDESAGESTVRAQNLHFDGTLGAGSDQIFRNGFDN